MQSVCRPAGPEHGTGLRANLHNQSAELWIDGRAFQKKRRKGIGNDIKWAFIQHDLKLDKFIKKIAHLNAGLLITRTNFKA